MRLKKRYKKYQRKFTKLIQQYNKAIDKDDLWLGRFHMIQIRSRWEAFDDNSGGILHAVIRCFDKKTRQYKDYFITYAPWMRTIHWHIQMDILNQFVVEDIDVWKENPNPRKSVKDWTKINDYKLDKNSNEDLFFSTWQLQKY